MGNPLVRFAGETEDRRRRLYPVFERGCRGQPPERVVDFDAVEAARIVLKKLFLRQLLRIKARPPAWISESGCAGIELRHRVQSKTMRHLLVNWLLSAVGLMIVAAIVPGI